MIPFHFFLSQIYKENYVILIISISLGQVSFNAADNGLTLSHYINYDARLQNLTIHKNCYPKLITDRMKQILISKYEYCLTFQHTAYFLTNILKVHFSHCFLNRKEMWVQKRQNKNTRKKEPFQYYFIIMNFESLAYLTLFWTIYFFNEYNKSVYVQLLQQPKFINV